MSMSSFIWPPLLTGACSRTKLFSIAMSPVRRMLLMRALSVPFSDPCRVRLTRLVSSFAQKNKVRALIAASSIDCVTKVSWMLHFRRAVSNFVLFSHCSSTTSRVFVWGYVFPLIWAVLYCPVSGLGSTAIAWQSAPRHQGGQLMLTALFPP